MPGQTLSVAGCYYSYPPKGEIPFPGPSWPVSQAVKTPPFHGGNLIGKDVEYCIPEIERRVREALLQDDRITAVQNFEFTVNKKKVLTTFMVVSIFGEINAELGVEI